MYKSEFRYAFFSGITRKNAGGISRLVLDTEKLIASRLSFPPVYSADSQEAIEDKNCLIVAVQPTRPVMANDIDHRRVGVSIRNIGFFDEHVTRQADVVLEPSFIPFTNEEKGRLSSSTKQFCTIHALPSRATPEAIRAAKEDFMASRADHEKSQFTKPITAVVVGDLSYFNEDPFCSINQIEELIKRRNNHAVLATSMRTDPEHAEILCRTLGNKLVHSYLWHKNKDQNNFYLAALGIAAQNQRGEILVTEDSRSMMSDAICTQTNMRILRTEVLTGELVSRETRISQNMGAALEKKGIPVNNDRPNERVPYRPDTGINAAVDAIVKVMQHKAADLLS